MSPTQRVLSLAVVNSVGFSATTAMALWITSVQGLLPVEPWWGSVVGACQLGAAAMSNLVAPYLFRRVSCEELARAAALFAAICAGFMAAGHAPWLFAAGAIGLGVGHGLMLNAANALLARSHAVQGNYATAQICEVAFAASFYFAAGTIIDLFGLRAIFLILSVLALLAALLMHRLSLSGRSPRDAPGAPTDGAIGWRGPATALAFILFFVGQASFYQHQVAIGSRLGIDPPAMSRLMALATMGGMMGAVAAKMAGLRFGLVRPLMVIPLALALVLIMAVRTQDGLIFAICAVMIQSLTIAIIPYVFTILATLDPTGRLPSRGPALLLLGVAGGPLLAEVCLRKGGYGLVGVAGAAIVLVSGLLFMMTGRGIRGGVPRAA
ncbi:hypothetical protein [Niveispirillum fermenti]|uniref:hypothetical protein n=1 Tax=Niveispirillum fermenti TaxID=1233113 RepID=UPI003A88EE87